MISAVCFYQEASPVGNNHQALEEMLSSLCSDYFEEQLNISWSEIRDGNGWTGVGKATGSNLAVFVPDMSNEDREQFLSDICSGWMRITGCSINEIVASAVNQDR